LDFSSVDSIPSVKLGSGGLTTICFPLLSIVYFPLSSASFVEASCGVDVAI